LRSHTRFAEALGASRPHDERVLEPVAHDVARCDLALALGYKPVFNADLSAGVRIRPTHDVAGREDARLARLPVLVDDNAAVDRKACGFGKCDRGTHADPRHDQVRPAVRHVRRQREGRAFLLC